jgi:hypothetical protein
MTGFSNRSAMISARLGDHWSRKTALDKYRQSIDNDTLTLNYWSRIITIIDAAGFSNRAKRHDGIARLGDHWSEKQLLTSTDKYW